ncbi:SpoIID/LytB domain-containing protein [Acetonema longum]|uniref:SpoIID/LytB domain-containing protein n=1 Tax=Acetonema longum DSM 6540 TaxID=1009370 RepID=F7NH99_9FIRM|nr:SpoIID/LytB domain-containing protein [Acetonema longum]EGO64582.1 SpoIID/LytB domain-containing protein [Acetonema longum DSM 6540]
MLDKQQSRYVIYLIIAVLIIAGVYAVLRPPAPKPLPEQPESAQEKEMPMPAVPKPPVKQEQPQPIPGVPKFNAAKYAREPVVKVAYVQKSRIESMPLEKYLEGVIAQEMEPHWPLEALKAQAVVARTLSLSAMEAGTIRRLRNADVSTSKDELQAYAPEKVNAAVRQAVRETRGQVLLYAGSLVNAIYSSCNGQIGATREESFPREIEHPTPYFQPVKDNCFEYAPENIRSWTVKVPGREVAAAVGYSGDPANIKILEKGPSGRILYIGAGNQKVYGAEFRKSIGYERLKSTLITDMSYAGGMFTFKGLGWGNGVGLCQWGAYTDAKQGKKAAEILKHYYQGVEIKKLWQ